MMPGLVHLYTGDGKGKTTAAVGLCVRAKGAGLSVVFAQFMKGSPTSEIEPLQALGVQIIRSDETAKFIFQMTEPERARYQQIQQMIFQRAVQAVSEDSPDLLVLDEAAAAVSLGLLSEEELLSFIRHRPRRLELVLTGRDFSQEILSCADYISEICAVKHPYQSGISARKGIEY